MAELSNVVDLADVIVGRFDAAMKEKDANKVKVCLFLCVTHFFRILRKIVNHRSRVK